MVKQGAENPVPADVTGVDRSHRRPVVLRELPFVPGVAIDAEHILSDDASNALTDNLKKYDAGQRATRGVW